MDVGGTHCLLNRPQWQTCKLESELLCPSFFTFLLEAANLRMPAPGLLYRGIPLCPIPAVAKPIRPAWANLVRFRYLYVLIDQRALCLGLVRTYSANLSHVLPVA